MLDGKMRKLFRFCQIREVCDERIADSVKFGMLVWLLGFSEMWIGRANLPNIPRHRIARIVDICTVIYNR